MAIAHCNKEDILGTDIWIQNNRCSSILIHGTMVVQ
jgi:hypothetical protein